MNKEGDSIKTVSIQLPNDIVYRTLSIEAFLNQFKTFIDYIIYNSSIETRKGVRKQIKHHIHDNLILIGNKGRFNERISLNQLQSLQVGVLNIKISSLSEDYLEEEYKRELKRRDNLLRQIEDEMEFGNIY